MKKREKTNKDTEKYKECIEEIKASLCKMLSNGDYENEYYCEIDSAIMKLCKEISFAREK